MYIHLPFNFLGLPLYKDRPVDIVLNMGTLESICDDAKIEFWELDKLVKDDPHYFMQMMLYYGYVTSCQKRYKRIKYTKADALRWANNINVTESAKLYILISELFGKLQKVADDKDIVKKK